MNEKNRKTSVYEAVNTILLQVDEQKGNRNLAGDLAIIRNSAGKNLEDSSEVWPILFPLLPREFLGNGPLTYEEKAVLVTLQLFAIGQQGSNKIFNDNTKSFGWSLNQIKGEDTKALDRRFNNLLTSTTFDEFVYHLRQMFKLAKSKKSFSVNYSALGEDLFWYQNSKSKQICLNWARDYYQPVQDKE